MLVVLLRMQVSWKESGALFAAQISAFTGISALVACTSCMYALLYHTPSGYLISFSIFILLLTYWELYPSCSIVANIKTLEMSVDGARYYSHFSVLYIHCWISIYLSVCLSVCLSIYISICGSSALCWALAAFQSLNPIHTVGRIPWTGDQRVARPLPRRITTQTQKKRTQTSMPPVGFELRPQCSSGRRQFMP
jgi:hypothetical protein